MSKILNYFTKGEIILWLCSVIGIVASFLIFDRESYSTLIISIIATTALIFNAKGNPLGQGLMIIFCVFYGVVSCSVRYYGEMLTYLGMSLPMAVISLISWLRNPFQKGKAEVKVNYLKRKDYMQLVVLTVLVTVAFYFILKYFNTANLLVSTVSVATSFSAVFLVAKRCPYYAIGYALNDIVLIILWSMVLSENIKYISIITCFVVFLVNDTYAFINWSRIKKRQAEFVKSI